MYKKSIKKLLVLVTLLIVGCEQPKPDQTRSSPTSGSIIDSIDILASKNAALNQVISENLGVQPGRYSKFFVSKSKESLNPEDFRVYEESRINNENWLLSLNRSMAISLNKTITEPDQSVDIYNRKGNQHVERIDVCGPSCKYIGIYWIDDSNFVSVAISDSEYYASSNVSQDSHTLLISQYNLDDNTVIKYRSSNISRPVKSKLPSNQTSEFSEKQFQQVLNAYIAANEGKDSGYERKEARQITYGDIDLDGDKDAVVEYILIGIGGGNSYGQNLAVFRNTNGQFEILADEVVGGKFYRSFKLENITNGKIHGVSETCSDTPQGVCQNPQVDQITFVVQDNKLEEE